MTKWFSPKGFEIIGISATIPIKGIGDTGEPIEPGDAQMDMCEGKAVYVDLIGDTWTFPKLIREEDLEPREV